MFIQLTSNTSQELRVNAHQITRYEPSTTDESNTVIYFAGTSDVIYVLEEPFVIDQKIENAQAGYANLFKTAR